MGIIKDIRNYWFPVTQPLVGSDAGITRAEDPKHVDRYIARVQLQRMRQDVITWRSAINEAELAYYPHRVKMQQLFNDTVLNGHVHACMEKRKSLTIMKKWELVDENGDIDEFWTNKFQGEWINTLINYALDSIFYGYSLINFGGISDDKLNDIRLIKRHNISPDRMQVVSYVYSLNGIQFETDEKFKDWLIYIPTPTENGISRCGYGLLYRIGYYEIMLRNVMGYNGDFVELYSQPFRYAKTFKTQDDERGEVENMLQNMGSSGWGIFDPNDEIGFLETSSAGTGYKGYESLEQRCESKISKIVLGHADALDSTPGKLGENTAVTEALEVIEKKDNDFITNFMNDLLLPKMRLHGVAIPENIQFQFCNDKEREQGQIKENEINKQIVDIVKILHDSGLKVDAKQVEDMTGFKLSEIESQNLSSQSLPKEVQNKLEELYKNV
jgi:hypothetical protein